MAHSRRQFLQSAGLTLAGSVVGSAHAAADSPGRRVDAEKIRGLMVDAGRLPERMDYYRRVIEFCAEWNLNTLQFRLADDQGSALYFTSAPGLVNHRNAFTPDQMRELARFAASHQVDLIPELESFGHTGYITRSSKYARLLDSETQESSEFSGVCPVNPETLDLFSKLYREVASIFPSPYLHGGCDEVNWGGSALSRRALAIRSRAQIWAAYLNQLHTFAEANGKEFIVWGDFVLHKEPEILSLLQTSVILMDWDYSADTALPVYETLSRARAKGFRILGAPALTCHGWGPRVGVEQLRNIDAFADSYCSTDDTGVLGVVLTNWIPTRYVQRSIWDGFAYAAVAFRQGTACAQTSAFHRFVEQHYGAAWNDTWDEVFSILYDFAPHTPERGTVEWKEPALPVPWSSDAQLLTVLRSSLRGDAPTPNPFIRLRSLLISLEPGVLTHLEDFQSFTLCVRYLEGLFWRESVFHTLREPSAKPSADTQYVFEETAGSLIQSIAARDAVLLADLERNWDEGRFADSPALSELLFGLEPRDELVYEWNNAAQYSAALAARPERLLAILARAGRPCAVEGAHASRENQG